jgi:hypothetical protein
MVYKPVDAGTGCGASNAGQSFLLNPEKTEPLLENIIAPGGIKFSSALFVINGVVTPCSAVTLAAVYV